MSVSFFSSRETYFLKLKFYNESVFRPILDYIRLDIGSDILRKATTELINHFSEYHEMIRQQMYMFKEKPKDLDKSEPFFRSYFPSIKNEMGWYSKFCYYYNHNYQYFYDFYQCDPKINQLCEIVYPETNHLIFDFVKEIIDQPKELLQQFSQILINYKWEIIGDCITVLNSTIQLCDAFLKDTIPRFCPGYILNLLYFDEKYSYFAVARSEKDCKGYISRIIPKTLSNLSQHYNQITLEIDILRKVKHQLLMPLQQLIEDDLFYYFIYPHEEGMDLESILQRGGKLSDEGARPIFRQLMQAVQFLHSTLIIHGQICPKNIILHNGRIRLFNYSSSKCLPIKPSDRIISCNYLYSPPEYISGKSNDAAAADVWACGCILFEMVAGRNPFAASTIEKVKSKVLKPNIVFPKHFSPQLISLLKGMLNPIVDYRITIEQVLSNVWTKKILEITVRNTLLSTPPASPIISPTVTRPQSPFSRE